MLLHLLRVLWVRWKTAAYKIATFQSRVLLFLFYYVILAPYALGMRAVSDPLHLRPDAPARWLPRPAPADDVTVAARRQF